MTVHGSTASERRKKARGAMPVSAMGCTLGFLLLSCGLAGVPSEIASYLESLGAFGMAEAKVSNSRFCG